jgi:hypothetical protein
LILDVKLFENLNGTSTFSQLPITHTLGRTKYDQQRSTSIEQSYYNVCRKGWQNYNGCGTYSPHSKLIPTPVTPWNPWEVNKIETVQSGDDFDETLSCFTDITSVSRNVPRPRPSTQVTSTEIKNVE